MLATTVVAFLLTVNLTAGTYVVQSLPDQVECDRVGKLKILGHKGAAYTCEKISEIVPPSSGNCLIAR